MIQAGDLRNLIDVYVQTTGYNELGEDTFQELELVKENVPAQIVPNAGYNRDMQGGLDATLVTHKIRVRNGVINWQPHMVIMYQGQRYDVQYWQPVYKNDRFMEIMTVMEVAI